MADEERGFTEDEWRQRILKNESVCIDCLRPYGDGGFPDLIIPYWAWIQISPTRDENGLLCPSCICKRLDTAGIRCEGAFVSGPIISVSRHAMDLERRMENIELALEGRRNRWGAALDERIKEGGNPDAKEPTVKQEHGPLPAEAGGAEKAGESQARQGAA